MTTPPFSNRCRGGVLFATDLAAEGVHFDRRQGTLADVGWRVLVQNLSDIAAMAGRPRAAVVAVAGAEIDELAEIYKGLLEASRRFRCPVVGGDLSDATVLNLSVAILGEVVGTAPVLRRGARPGETIHVTGPLGAASAGLRELRANPIGRVAVRRRVPPARAPPRRGDRGRRGRGERHDRCFRRFRDRPAPAR